MTWLQGPAFAKSHGDMLSGALNNLKKGLNKLAAYVIPAWVSILGIESMGSGIQGKIYGR